MAPKIGAIRQKSNFIWHSGAKVARPQTLYPRPQRPKWGRSPLRLEMRALAISRRSIVAITRANREFWGTRPTEAVLDMDVPFSCGAERFRPVIWGQFMYTRYQSQQTCLHSSNQPFAMQHKWDNWHSR